MSITGQWTITFDRPCAYSAIIRSLSKHGWSLDAGAGGIMYSILNSRQNPQTLATPLEKGEKVLDLADRLEGDRMLFSIHLSWNAAGIGVQVTFGIPGGPIECMYVDTTGMRATIPDSPTRETDHTWYEDRIVAVLKADGFVITDVKWEGDD